MANALATLSSFAILGLRERQDLFLAQLADLVGIPPGEALPPIPDFVRTPELSQRLKEVPEAGLLIEYDLEVYHQVEEAIKRALGE